MDNSSIFNDSYFFKAKIKQKRKIGIYSSKDNTYNPLRVYIKKEGFGRGKRFKNKSLEWLFIQRYQDALRLLAWTKKAGLKPEALFRAHLTWISKAFTLLPRPHCYIGGCNNQVTYFSIRRSSDGQISFGLPFVCCEEHRDDLIAIDSGRVSIAPLLFSSVKNFELKKDQKMFLSFFKDCFNFKNLSGQSIFKVMKKALPDLKIELPVNAVNGSEEFKKQNENKENIVETTSISQPVKKLTKKNRNLFQYGLGF